MSFLGIFEESLKMSNKWKSESEQVREQTENRKTVRHIHTYIHTPQTYVCACNSCHIFHVNSNYYNNKKLKFFRNNNNKRRTTNVLAKRC